MTCLFCKIINREIPSETIYEDDEVLAFKDIHPQAPIHILVIPKKHLENTSALISADQNLMGKIVFIASQIAKDLNISESGYRLVMNCNQEGGQTVYHLHLHLIGGKPLGPNMAGG